MVATTRITGLTAADLMTTDLVCLAEETPLRVAVSQLLKNQISGAPVVDKKGRCIGVFSAMDMMRLAQKRADVTKPLSPPLPLTCSFQKRDERRDRVVCTLPLGVCPIQVVQKAPGGADSILCGQPNCVLLDWQVVEVEKLPVAEVSKFMTANPVLVTPETSIRDLARLMLDAHIHRLIVTDEESKPVGIVSSTDLLAVLASAPDEEADQP